MLDNIFEELKCRLFMSDVARFYGLEINRAGFAACPFHPDNTPSLKIYEDHYYCFGCGAHGDVTDFTARLFRISQYDAAVKLNDDFGLHLTNQKTVPMKQAVSPEVAYRLAAQRRMYPERISEYALPMAEGLCPENAG